MKLISTTALALVAAFAAVPASAQDKQPAPAQQAAPQIKPSGKALKALADLQATVNKKDYANVPAKIAAAEAVASTKEDRYLIGKLQLDAAVGTNDKAGIAAAVDKIAASGELDSAKVASLYVGVGGSFYNDKQYPQASAAYQKALSLDPRNAEATKMVGESLFAAGQKAEAAAAFQRALQASAAAGQKPDEALLKRAVAVAYDAQSPTAVDLARQWAGAYPSASSWSDAIAIYRNLNHPDTEGTLDLLRLKQTAGALKDSLEYGTYIRAAADQNNYNEAQAVYDAGVAAKVINPADPNFKDITTALKVKAKATAADLEAASKVATTGSALIHIGDRYASMGNNAKAVELYKMALAKPGTDASIANLHIGMALAKSGDKAGATAALNAVAGPRAEVAKFWLAYLNSKA
jgi:tetratricopeptide (TPR) repeat protein